ncbi:sensor histidine kinase [Pseudarthrobacter sp. P1]|uniref:sensor histidine kinase n=1 Tax=Pseudarthrobacter sp. P1 TaxID=3418418 RepID=UPI003CF9EE1A
MTTPRTTPAPSARPGRPPWGVRKRATATAVAVVAGALLIGGVLLLVLLQASLVSTTKTASQRVAADVAALITSQDVSEASQFVTNTAHAGQYVQILGAEGMVLASSDPSATTPVAALKPAAGQMVTQDVSSLASIGDSDDFLIVATGVEAAGTVFTVVVASTVQVQVDTVSTVAWFMLGATPVLLAVVGAAVWVLVGRSLRQVERIRGQVASIDAGRLNERVDVPSTHDEIQALALALTMNTMLDQLQISDAEQRRFVSDASHELRSPLATLTAGVEISAADPTGQTWYEMKDVLAGETLRMSYLVDDLLTLAKANDGGIRIRMDDVDLDDVLDQEIRRLRSVSHHAVTADIAPARITGDARRLGQVLRNVLDNANRHARTRITVNLATGPRGIVVDIDNDGEPVPEADRERVFERFVRLDRSRSRESGGSGLGLAIAAGIMAAHRGSITTTVGPNGDCRFEPCLPPGPLNPALDITAP